MNSYIVLSAIVLAEAPVMEVIIITIIQIVDAILIATAAADKFVK